MSRSIRAAAIVALGALIPLGARAQDKCSVEGVLAGKSFTMRSCAVAYLDDQHGVTLWFDEKPISPKDAEAFQMSAYAPDGRRLLQLGFCPGGGKATPDPKAPASVDFRIEDGSSPLHSRQWVFELPGDKRLQIERLSGKLELGGRLAGRITGERTSDGLAYSWRIDFDVKLPAKSAAAGPSCGQ